jgi:tRNA(fMet)-specific endonuclease VapC
MAVTIENETSAPVAIIDTDVFSYWFKGDSHGNQFRQYAKGYYLALSFASLGELYYWAYKNKWGERRLKTLEQSIQDCLILPYDDLKLVCQRFASARVPHVQGAHFELINYMDYWTAACALKYNYPIITNNVEHFSRIKGIKLLGPYSN